MRFFFSHRDHYRDQNLFRKKRSPFFILKSLRDISGKNAPRFFHKKRIAIATAARGCRCSRGGCRAVCAEVVNFSQTDRDFFTKNGLRFFRENRSAFFLFRSRSRSRLKIFSGRTGTGFFIAIAPRFFRKRDAAAGEKQIYLWSNILKYSRSKHAGDC